MRVGSITCSAPLTGVDALVVPAAVVEGAAVDGDAFLLDDARVGD